MKKSLLALAVLGAFAGAASAQSSVTVYGYVDLGVGKTIGSEDKEVFDAGGEGVVPKIWAAASRPCSKSNTVLTRILARSRPRAGSGTASRQSASAAASVP